MLNYFTVFTKVYPEAYIKPYQEKQLLGKHAAISSHLQPQPPEVTARSSGLPGW